MNPWDRQKELSEEGKIPTQKEIILKASELSSVTKTNLYLLTYLTAGRISEILELKAESFERIEREGRHIILIKMPNRKNRKRHWKDIPIPLDKPLEAEMINTVLNNIKSGYIFDFRTTSRAWQIFKEIGINPHWLRHVRLTHLETIYGLSGERVKNFAGWTDTRPAKHYMELNWGDILKGM